MTQLLQNALYGAALILAAALLRRVLKDRLMPEARLALWAVCLFRLLTPIAPESALSLWGLARLSAPEMQSAPVSGISVTPSSSAVPASPALPPSSGLAASPSPTASPFPWETVLLAVWLVVGVVLAVRYALSWARTRRAVAGAVPLPQSDPRYAPLPPFVRLREGPMEGAPLTFGAVRPTVVLSPSLEGESLACVLAHEGVHAARRDNLWHYAMALALAVHWWNPAVWLMARLLRRDIELSCDRAAVRRLGADQRAAYANTLVSLSTQKPGPAFSQSFGFKATEERIRSIMKFKKTSVIGVILTLALVLAVTAAFASSPREPEPTLEIDGVTLTGDAARYALQLHAGMTREEVYQLLGEPHSMLSGLDGDIYILDRIGKSRNEPSYNAPAFFIYYYGRYGSGSESYVGQIGFRASEDQGCKLIQYYADETGVYSQSPGCDWVSVDPSKLGGVVPVIEDQNGDPIDLSRYDSYDSVKTGETSSAITASTITFLQYAASLEPYVASGKITQDEADWNLELFIQGWNRVQMGEADFFSYNAFDGDRWVGTIYLSDRATAGYPINTKGETYGSDALADIYGASPDLVAALGTNGEEGYIRRSEADHAGYPGTVNNPEEAMAYMAWCEAHQGETFFAPLYDCEGNVIGQFAVGITAGTSYTLSPSGGQANPGEAGYGICAYPTVDALNSGVSDAGVPVCGAAGCTVAGEHHHEGDMVVYHYSTLPLDFAQCPVCPVEGCTTQGYHSHDSSTVYACNGVHCGGVCDGSCVVYFNGGSSAVNDAPAGEEIPVFEPDYDPQTEDSIPVAPVNSPGSGHHSGSHHSSGHH